MKKPMSKILIAASLMLASASSNAEQVTGTVSYFYASGIATIDNSISVNSLGMIVDGLFYYSNNLSPSVITSIDLARRAQNGTVTFAATAGREITGAY